MLVCLLVWVGEWVGLVVVGERHIILIITRVCIYALVMASWIATYLLEVWWRRAVVVFLVLGRRASISVSPQHKAARSYLRIWGW